MPDKLNNSLMSKAIKTVRKFNQDYKSFNFTVIETNAEEFLESVIELDALVAGPNR